jgi:hypothetical protein
VTFTATTAPPYEHLGRATAGLRAELRRRLLTAGVHRVPAWHTFVITGPVKFTDARRRRSYEYSATVDSRGPFDRPGTGNVAA